jgi:hypothetical protein
MGEELRGSDTLQEEEKHKPWWKTFQFIQSTLVTKLRKKPAVQGVAGYLFGK